MRKYANVVDQISSLYITASTNSVQIEKFKKYCWYLICAKVGASIVEGDPTRIKEDNLWLSRKEICIESKSNSY
jgi:hypothetical protein